MAEKVTKELGQPASDGQWKAGALGMRPQETNAANSLNDLGNEFFPSQAILDENAALAITLIITLWNPEQRNQLCHARHMTINCGLLAVAVNLWQIFMHK